MAWHPALEAKLKGVTFPAWRGTHYVTLAELLLRFSVRGDVMAAS
jgi:hypothetical protein